MPNGVFLYNIQKRAVVFSNSMFSTIFRSRFGKASDKFTEDGSPETKKKKLNTKVFKQEEEDGENLSVS